ncbi:hypothetical protein B0H34DRAFT_858927 [Crassisporium funariophilum]|nr:hypothetical protein B0H34DRAFT_858927 [Crassisporium funariophilum]
MSSSCSLLSRRLDKDLLELKDNSYPGLAVSTNDSDRRKLCLVLIPPSGPYKDLALHFDVVLRQDWPTEPPYISSSVPIRHPSILENVVWCNLLKAHQRGLPGAYSPAVTLRGFIQLLTIFSSTKIEQAYSGIIDIGDYFVAQYMKDGDIVKRIFDQNPFYGESYQSRGKQHKGDQVALEKQWKEDATPEVVFGTYLLKSEKGMITHKLKPAQNRGNTLHKVEKVNPLWISTHELVRHWSCTSCPYGSKALPHLNSPQLVPRQSADEGAPFQRPSKCHLSALNDDTLEELADHLSTETLISFAAAYPRFSAVVDTFHVLLHRQLVCFFLRTPLSQSILGVGIAFDNFSQTLSSDFDWLGMEAFDTCNVRKSVRDLDFEFFLPLAFNRLHFYRVESEIWKRLAIIDAAVCDADWGQFSNRPLLRDHQTVEVLFRMMNNIVVSLMQSCDEILNGSKKTRTSPTLLHISEKAIMSYCHLFHLLSWLCRSTPAIHRGATLRLRNFVTRPESRVKSETPDLGALIVTLTLVLVLSPIDSLENMSWEAIGKHFLEEAIIRNVPLVLQGAPELEVMEDGVSYHRLYTTFMKSKTSLRLIMFQTMFLNLFIQTYDSGISSLDESYGFADKALPQKMVGEIMKIYAVDTWAEFFGRVKFDKGVKITNEQFSNFLRKTVQSSGDRGYHGIACEGKLHRQRMYLKRKRAALEDRARGLIKSKISNVV